MKAKGPFAAKRTGRKVLHCVKTSVDNCLESYVVTICGKNFSDALLYKSGYLHPTARANGWRKCKSCFQGE